MQKVVILGASGQLGQCIKQIAEKENIPDMLFPSEEVADILAINKLKKIFEEYQPQYCINCAAYTAVDKAEDDIDTARKVNKEGAHNLARLCREYGTILIHVSTDFVFEGNRPCLLTEDDEANPVNVYGLTKLEGENEIMNIFDKYYIIRTSWLYSEYGNNFVKTMLKLGRERDEIKVIADQIGTPTYGVDLAAAILNIISSGKTAYGIYHYSNEGVASWYDFAKAIFDIAEINVNVLPVHTSEYVAKASRPAFSAMDKSKIKDTFTISIPYWRDSLIRCINSLNK
jgi:dTDP-4-dehydrorhamnose reductase